MNGNRMRFPYFDYEPLPEESYKVFGSKPGDYMRRWFGLGEALPANGAPGGGIPGSTPPGGQTPGGQMPGSGPAPLGDGSEPPRESSERAPENNIGMDRESGMAASGAGGSSRSIGNDYGYMDIGDIGRWGMRGLGLVPGPIGMVAGLANAGMNANNMGAVNAARQARGLPELGFGQMAGGVMGLNDYASGYVGDVDIGGQNYGVSLGGDVFGGRTTLDPREAQQREQMAEARAAYGGGDMGGGQEAFGGFDRDAFGGGEAGTNSGDTSDSSYYANGGAVRPGAVVHEASYVIPADVVAAMGDGSTMAGAKKLSQTLMGEMVEGEGDGRSDSVLTQFADGGKLALSQGEVVIPPKGVKKAGGPSVLERMVKQTRKKFIRKLKKLPGPHK